MRLKTRAPYHSMAESGPKPTPVGLRSLCTPAGVAETMAGSFPGRRPSSGHILGRSLRPFPVPFPASPSLAGLPKVVWPGRAGQEAGVLRRLPGPRPAWLPKTWAAAFCLGGPAAKDTARDVPSIRDGK